MQLSALFKSGALTSAVTGVDGSFTLTNVPVGTSVPLVLQIGKWRRSVHVNVGPCQANPQSDKSLTLPGTVAAGSDDNIPDIAVSTGSADTLECLMLRIGLPASEYVAGAGNRGQVHVFSGGDPTGNSNAGTPETPSMPGAPQSNSAFWDMQDHLMPYDITLLSCEGEETYAANPPALEAYLNAEGRVFASHFHYAWFSGPIGTGQSYAAPLDWGSNLATWQHDNGSGSGPIGGVIETTLNGSSMPFPKGFALQQSLMGLGALAPSPTSAADLCATPPTSAAASDVQAHATDAPAATSTTADAADAWEGSSLRRGPARPKKTTVPRPKTPTSCPYDQNTPSRTCASHAIRGCAHRSPGSGLLRGQRHHRERRPLGGVGSVPGPHRR